MNAHFRAKQLKKAGSRLRRRDGLDVTVIRQRTPDGPAGGMLACRDVMPTDVCCVVVSGDAVTGVDIGALVADHTDKGADLTILGTRVDDPGRFGVLGVIGDQVVGFVEKPANAGHGALINCGVYVIGGRILQELQPPAGAVANYDFEHVVPQLLAQGRSIRVHPSTSYWNDIGTPAALVDANLHMLSTNALGRVAAIDSAVPGLWHQGVRRQISDIRTGGRVLIGEGAVVGAGSQLDNVVVGTAAVVGPYCRLENVVVLPHSQLPAGTELSGGLWAR